MVIGGIQKNSFIDYPGKVSCVLFLSGCNFRCPYCHNPDLVLGAPRCRAFLEDSWVLDFLKKRRGCLDAVVISGGEPTLQEELFEFCSEIKALGFPVKIDTNGSRPTAIEALIRQNLVDYIAMDIKTAPECYPGFLSRGCTPESILTSIRIIMASGVDYEFRTTCIKPLINADLIRRIAATIEGSPLYALQKCRQTDILDPDFFQNTSQICEPQEMEYFRSIAAHHVKSCIVR
jgi:pyruvate formate lyase activating enzyme